MKQLFVALLLSLAAGSFAHADLMIEPYLGYETGNLSTKGSGADTSDETKGVVPGLRLGYAAPAVLWVALDYSIESNGKISGTDYDRSNLFLDVGADLLLIRLWGGYGFSNSLTTKPTSGNNSNFSGGSMLKAGIGFTFLPFVSLNLEYMAGSFGSYPSSNSSAKETMALASISIPMNF